MEMRGQILELTGVGNARELGGYPAGCLKIRPGVLLRTAGLVGATEQDKERLEKEYHVAVVIDFRMSYERSMIPDPVVPGAQNIFLPVMEMEDTPGFEPAMLKKFDLQNMDRMALMQMAIDMGMMDEKIYTGFVLGERGIAAYRGFFKELLKLEEGSSVLWHCTDGKDRTGVAAALLLFALGASRETVMEDYLMTNVMNEKVIRGVRARLEQMEMSPEHKKIMAFGSGAVYEEYLDNALQAIEEKYGSIDSYLETALGVGSKEREVLRGKFLQ